MSNSLEQGLKEALIALKKEMDSNGATPESIEKAKLWTQMIKLQEEINESNNRAK